MRSFLRRQIQRSALIGSFIMIVGFIVLIPFSARAGLVSSITASFSAALFEVIVLPINVVATIISALAALVSFLLFFVAQYNDFLDNPVVSLGWIAVRDFANLFFILILLLIAFSTILGSEKLHFKQHLTKLLLMAIVINFSKMITGLLIDASQIVMLTFLGPIADRGPGSLMNSLGLLAIGKASRIAEAATTGKFEFVGQLVSLLTDVLFMAVGTVVMAVMLVMLVARVVMLWILIILSPLAYILSTFPQGEKYASQWWGELAKYLLNGPVLAFFLWLALTVKTGDSLFGAEKAKTLNQNIQQAQQDNQQEGAGTPGGKSPADVNASAPAVGLGKLGEPANVTRFIITIAFLLAGLKFASEIGGAGSGAATATLGKFQKWGADAGKFVLRRADDYQAGLQKKFATKYGEKFGGKMEEWAAGKGDGSWKWGGKVGQKIIGSVLPGKEAMERLKVHGVAVRTVQEAIKASQDKYESQQLGESKAVATDLFNRTLPWQKDRTNFTEIARGERVEELEHYYEKGGQEKNVLLSQLKQLMYKDKDGKWKAREGKEGDVEAIFRLMTKNHDINEVLKDTDIGKSYDLQHNRGNIKNLLIDTFGDNEEARRVGHELGMIGLANGDGYLYNMAAKTFHEDKTTGQVVGEFKFWDEMGVVDKNYDEIREHRKKELVTARSKDRKVERQQRMDAAVQEAERQKGAPLDNKEKVAASKAALKTFIDEINAQVEVELNREGFIAKVSDEDKDKPAFALQVKLHQEAVDKFKTKGLDAHGKPKKPEEITDPEEKKFAALRKSFLDHQQSEVVAFYEAKRPGRQGADKLRRQDLFVEFADQSGNLHFRELHDTGKEVLKKSAQSLAQQFQYATQETRDAVADNLDLIVEYLQEGHASGELNDEQAANIWAFVAQAAGAGGYNDPKSPQNPKPSLANADQNNHYALDKGTQEFVESRGQRSVNNQKSIEESAREFGVRRSAKTIDDVAKVAHVVGGYVPVKLTEEEKAAKKAAEAAAVAAAAAAANPNANPPA